MDISNDFIRRELDDIARQNDRAMAHQREALHRMVDSGELDTNETDELVTGGLGRRRFLKFGGIAIATSAVFAACGSSSKTTSTPTTAASSPTTAAGGTGTGSKATDITILRTASSLEALAVETYATAIKSGLVTTPAVAAAAKNFMEQHQQHAQEFESATSKAGGTPFTTPNPVVKAAVITPALPKLKSQTDVLALAYTLESAASQTYQSAIGAFSQSAYNTAAASVLGVESRHQALFGILLNNAAMPAYPAGGFQSDTGAVKAGTGV